MRILSVGVNLEPASGGTYTITKHFHDALNSDRDDCRTVSFSSSRMPHHDENIANISTGTHWMSKKQLWWNSPPAALEQLMQGIDFVFLHGIYLQPLLRVSRYAWGHGIPYVVVPHGSLDPYVFSYRGMRKRLWLRMYRREAVLRPVCLLFATPREHEKALCIQGGCGAVIHWPTKFVPNYDRREAKAKLLGQHGISPNRRLALFCGRVHPMKRPVETIRAFLEVAPPDWTLLLVGPASDEIPARTLEALTADSTGRIKIVGLVDKLTMDSYYQASDLVILASHRENFGIAVAEAMACGVPVLVSEGVDLYPEVKSCGGGVVIRHGSIDEIRQGLRQIISMSAAHRLEMGERARHWARANLSPGRFAEQLRTLAYSAIARQLHGKLPPFRFSKLTSGANWDD